MKILLLGANGYLGPHVVKALAPRHQLRITDIKPAPDQLRQQFADQEFSDLDITSAEAVLRAAEGMDAMVNLAAVRRDPAVAFAVNTLGCLHVMEAAVQQGIRRVIHTGPHSAVAGPSYEQFDFAISPDVPPHPGSELYPLSKSLGLQISRTYAEQHDLYVQHYLYSDFREVAELKPGLGGGSFLMSWGDAAEMFRLGLEIDLARLPSKCETFFLLGNCPQGQFSHEKARRILGFEPKADLGVLWRPGR